MGSRALFYGKIRAARSSEDGCDADQHELLLSKEARVDTKPQIEILADDVKARMAPRRTN